MSVSGLGHIINQDIFSAQCVSVGVLGHLTCHVSYILIFITLLQVHPLFILSVADFVLAILWLIGGIVWLNPDEYGWAKENSASHTGMCYVLAVATTVSNCDCKVRVHELVGQTSQ